MLFLLAFLSSAIRVDTTYYIDRIAELSNADLDDLRQFIAPHPHETGEGFDTIALFDGKTYDADGRRNEQGISLAK
ncbi:hypothetical protein DFJ58DRAFT_759019 [Suillus subalutaceus]|uniref:uncharacterized protein n=1 Tax=Suillus subalutaceus TaxID=48586 RepID=UPI001B883164|nr:uncharacterized protein DFJ58DRAFT_759019 [Suillus subalutaceus]KAG1873567.1 hypothetical protein DFJ58DRAFT_759019 [Suillus subalutaceus]